MHFENPRFFMHSVVGCARTGQKKKPQFFMYVCKDTFAYIQQYTFSCISIHHSKKHVDLPCSFWSGDTKNTGIAGYGQGEVDMFFVGFYYGYLIFFFATFFCYFIFHLEAILRPSWTILGPSWSYLRASWSHLCRHMMKYWKILKKTMIYPM